MRTANTDGGVFVDVYSIINEKYWENRLRSEQAVASERGYMDYLVCEDKFDSLDSSVVDMFNVSGKTSQHGLICRFNKKGILNRMK